MNYEIMKCGNVEIIQIKGNYESTKYESRNYEIMKLGIMKC
jgi:hypothetical protein